MSARTSGLLPTALVGRECERGRLRDALAATLAGQGGLVLIAGEAGIGKTALAEAICREANAQEALVLVGHCYDLTDTPPYGPWRDLFAHYPAASQVPPPAAFAQREAIGDVASQAALIGQVMDFFAALTALRPVVVLLDDLHWADPASLTLLRALAREVGQSRLLILATYRAEELDRQTPLATLLPVLVRESQATRLALHPLAPGDLRAWVTLRYRLDPAATARLLAYIQDRAEGNPFYVTRCAT